MQTIDHTIGATVALLGFIGFVFGAGIVEGNILEGGFAVIAGALLMWIGGRYLYELEQDE